MFLETYKFLEEMLRQAYGAEMSVLEYENRLTPEEQGRMAMCRRIRNYAQHHTDAESFVGITEPMLRFITSHAQMAASARNTVDKVAKKVKPLTTTADVKDICAWRLKYGTDFAPIVDKNACVIGFVDDEYLMRMICKSVLVTVSEFMSMHTATLSDKLSTARGRELGSSEMLSQPEFAEFLDNGGTIAVTRESDRKYLGILSRKVGNWS